MSKKKIDNSRRDFIRNSALALGGFYILPRHVIGGKGFTAPSDKLQIAGIGAGGKGESDLFNFYNSGKADIAFLCDVDDRQCAKSWQRYPKAKRYKDYREMLDKEHMHIDACSVSTPDHMHAVQAMAAMQLGKHVYVQKPMAHDIYEARVMTKAAHDYNVVTQMGNQGASGDGVRMLQDWHTAGLIGDIHTIYCYTDRPVWPQGVNRPILTSPAPIPAELDFNLWLGTAPQKDYFEGLLPFNWRGWWDYGTGALGDMACHIMAPAFAVAGLGYPIAAECSVSTRYTAPWQKLYAPDSGPMGSHITLTFQGQNGKPNVKLHWMDGGIQPERPEELGHYSAWVEACIAGAGSAEAKALSSNFDIAGPLTESVLMGNLAIRSYDLKKTEKGRDSYPGRNIQLLWDGPNMKITNFDEANQYVKRTYRDGWSLGV